MNGNVLDASVAAKWILPPQHETLVAEAQLVLDQYANGKRPLIVPDLFWPEIGNIIWKATRMGRISVATAEAALANLLQRRIPTVATKPLLSSALAIAFAHGRTVYDSVYVALAAANDKPLLTADERLANALGTNFPIRWLGNLTAENFR